MHETSTSTAIVVGVDGSESAGDAVRWAVDEAINRDVRLRLVHVVDVEDRHGVDTQSELNNAELRSAEAALRAAMVVVHASGRPVRVETAILRGAVSAALVDESNDAALLCVGSVGADGHPGELLGATAAALAENSACPVALIRNTRDQPACGVSWIVVLVTDHPDNDLVVESAIREAQLRRAPVLAVEVWAEDLSETTYDELDRRMSKWKLRFPDVPIHPVATTGGIGHFLAGHAEESIQLAVIGEHDIDQIAYLVWPDCHPESQHGERSVLVIPRPARVGDQR
ncbi:universal stress protein [soil metagenome]